MCENKKDGVLAWHDNESLATWVEYAYQLKKYLLEDTTKRVFVYGREDQMVEYRRVTHGHWEDENVDDQVIARCSVCNTWNTARTPFCPYCGSPMDEEGK